MSKSKKPKYMITYLCNKCGFDFAMTELDKPKCFYCESGKDWKVVKKQKITMKVIAERMEKVNDRMMKNLKSAYKAGKERGDFDEDLMLEVLDKSKKIQEGTRKIFKNNKKNEVQNKKRLKNSNKIHP